MQILKMAIPSRTIPWPEAFTILLLLLLTPLSSSSETEPTEKRKYQINAKHAAVATDDTQCSNIGRDVIRDGGHAVDAAVAAALCLGVVNPSACGIGGGAFMLVRTDDGNAQIFDMRETAPNNASTDMYKGDETLKLNGPLSIAVPGQLAGLHEAWKLYGRLPWRRLVVPAENLARFGFKISAYLGDVIYKFEQQILNDTGLRSVFTSNGTPLREGDTCRNTKLADTLRQISMDGLKSFYHGEIASNLVKDVQEAGGILSIEDMQNYRAKIREPIYTRAFGHDIIGMPPPSSGGASNALILHILEQYGSSLNASTPLMTHRTIEAIKHAFAMRMNLGDPDFVDIREVLNDMLSNIVAHELKKTINDSRTFPPRHYGGRWNIIPDHGTSHLSVVDTHRNAVAMTNTINFFFGSLILSPSTGVILNNEMDDFSMPANTSENVPPPMPANFIVPGKRPMSSMSPTIVLQGRKLMAVIGGSGGPRIIPGVTEVFLNYFVNRMDPLASVVAPRFYHQLVPNVVYYENWKAVSGYHFEVPKETRNFLEESGHVLESVTGEAMLCQVVFQDLESNELMAVSDPRKGGFPAGF